VVSLDPPAHGQLHHERAIQAPGGTPVQVLDRSVVPQFGFAKPRLEPAVLTLSQFAVDQQAGAQERPGNDVNNP